MERLADELPIEQVAKRWIVSSDPDEAVALVKQYRRRPQPPRVPCTRHDQRRFLDNFARDLAPKLRELVPRPDLVRVNPSRSHARAAGLIRPA